MEVLFTADFLINLFAAGVRLAAPLLMAALGEIIAERSGLLNIGIEGIMLLGALFAVFGSDFTGSAWMGALAAILTGAVLGLIFAFVTVSLTGDQVVTGTAINILALGLSTYLFRLAYGLEGFSHQVEFFRPLAIPVLSSIPFIGPIFFQQSLLVYLAFIFVPLTGYFLFHTMWGTVVACCG